MNVIETESAIWNSSRFVIWRFFIKKLTFSTVMIFGFLVPVVEEYSYDLHAKKKAPLHRSATWDEKEFCFCLYNCLSSSGVIAFCAFSFGPERLNEVNIEEMWRCVLLSQFGLGSGLSLFVKVVANSDKALLTVPVTNGSVYRAWLCSPLRIKIAKAATIRGF